MKRHKRKITYCRIVTGKNRKKTYTKEYRKYRIRGRVEYRMVSINTPEIYINEPGAIHKVADYTELAIGEGRKKAYIIWSKTPRSLVKEALDEDFGQKGIAYEEQLFEGFPTDAKARSYAEEAKAAGAEVILGVGGGRVMDVTKAAGTYSGLPVITVPTIAATCAAWAAVSIIYTDQGDFDKFLFNPKSAKYIVADTDIIAKAPVRYLKAGIVDTFAKWYEPVYRETPSFTMQISTHTAKLAFDFLRTKGPQVVEQAEAGIVNDDTIAAVDAIIYLAGNIGSFVGKEAFSGLAHPFYHSSRRYHSTYIRLHGEIVAFALVVQGIYEERSREEIAERIRILRKFDNTYTLEELGLSEEEQLITIAERMQSEFEGKQVTDEETAKLVAAMKETDRRIKEMREA